MTNNSQKRASKENDFEEKIGELKEWQENQYNPGYYIGSGRIPKPVKEVKRKPLFLLIIAFFMLLPAIAIIIFDFSIENLFAALFPTLISLVLLYAAVREVIDNWKNKRSRS